MYKTFRYVKAKLLVSNSLHYLLLMVSYRFIVRHLTHFDNGIKEKILFVRAESYHSLSRYLKLKLFSSLKICVLLLFFLRCTCAT